MIIAVNFPVWAVGGRKPERGRGFGGIRARGLRDACAMRCRLGCGAAHWGRGQLIEFMYSPEGWSDVGCIWGDSCLGCGGGWGWGVVVAVDFPV